jgi:hypothetical protein
MKLAILGLVFTCSLLLAPPVWADESQRDVDVLIEEGLRLRRERRDHEALDFFRRAYDLAPAPRTRAQIGLAQQALGNWVDAEKEVLAALAYDSDPWIVLNTASLQRALAAIQGELGAIEVRTNVPAAELLIDDEFVGKLPYGEVRVRAGQRKLEVRASGYRPFSERVVVRSRGTLQKYVGLVPIAEPTSERARKPVVPPGSSTGPAAAKQPPSSARRNVAWAAIATGVLLLIEGAAAHYVREQRAAAYNDDQRCFFGTLSRDERCGSYRQDAEIAQWAAIIGYGAGSLAVGTGIFLLQAPVSPPSRETGRAPVGVVPTVFTYHHRF